MFTHIGVVSMSVTIVRLPWRPRESICLFGSEKVCQKLVLRLLLGFIGHWATNILGLLLIRDVVKLLRLYKPGNISKCDLRVFNTFIRLSSCTLISISTSYPKIEAVIPATSLIDLNRLVWKNVSDLRWDLLIFWLSLAIQSTPILILIWECFIG